MVQEILAFSVAPLVAAGLGALYSVRLVDRAKDVRFAVFLLLFAALGAVETVGLWRVLTVEGHGYSDTLVEVTGTSVTLLAFAAVFVTGRILDSEEGELQEMNQQIKEMRADLEEERQTNELLRDRLEELEIYDEMVSSVPDMVFAIDDRGRFIEVNEAMHRLLGFPEEDLLEMSFHGVMAEEKTGELTVESEEQKVLVEHQARTKEGENFPVELHMARLRGKSDVTKGIVGMARDITERKEREQRLDVLNRFFRHNVRNELTVVKGSAGLLVDNLSGEQRKYAERIHERAEVLEQMSDKARTVGHLLDARPEIFEFDALDTIESAVSGFRDSTPGITVEAPEGLRVEAVEGLEFAIENLVENAVEHSEKDTPRVEVRATAQDDEAVIEVHDDGVGIPRQEIQTITEGTEDPLQHGSGIGLWAVKWIVERSNGDLSFGESPLGGALVTLTFNRA